MANYRDYGTIIDGGTPAPLVETSNIKYGQVYLATHNGVGGRLPLMNRSFISFSYGGKWIEDFNLLATVSGDRMEKEGYAAFEDNTKTYSNLDGQKYLSTHYTSHTFDFHLSTDGIDQKMLDDFLYWFHAGEARELILSEHPNRGILARVSQPPKLSLLPFEHPITVMINEQPYSMTTTLFKGDIDITLVSDDPHWYSIRDVLGTLNKDHTRYQDYWTNVNGEQEYIYASKDALKILYEDNIPIGSMIQDSMLLSNGAFANTGLTVISKIWSVSEMVEDWRDVTKYQGARIDNGNGTMGVIAGAIIDLEGNGIMSLPNKYASQDNAGYFYYAGTAPAYTEIRFTLQPEMDNGTFYIISPRNSHSPINSTYTHPYNTITVESINSQELVFTTPNVYTSYNKSLEIIYKYVNSEYTWADVRATIRDNVRHTRVREWAIKIIDLAEKTWPNNGLIDSTVELQTMGSWMAQVFKDEEGNIYPITVTLNSETGAASGEFTMRLAPDNQDMTTENIVGNFGINNSIQKEDVGDMLRSNYIIIRDRNYPNNDGRLVTWSNTNDVTKSYSHRITHDVSQPLTRFLIRYKHMYL